MKSLKFIAIGVLGMLTSQVEGNKVAIDSMLSTKIQLTATEQLDEQRES